MEPKIPQSRRSYKNWLTHFLLTLLTALVCTVGLPVFAKVPSLLSSPTETHNLVEQGKTLYDAREFSEAVKVLQQALQSYQAQGDELKQAITLSNLSLAYQQLGLWNEAKKAITDSLNLLQSVGDSVDSIQVKAQILNTQGRLLLHLGQAEQALDTWQQATKAYNQAGDDTGSILSSINQSFALQALGLYRRAVTTLTDVNQTLLKQPDSLLKIAGLRQLGNALRVVGDLDKSRQVLQQSLTIAQKLRSPQEISASLLSLGNIARVQQDTQGAIAFYQQAATASPSPITKIQAQLNQLNLLLETEQLSTAQTLLPQLQEQIPNLPASDTAIYARIDFAQSLMKQGSRGAGGQDLVLTSVSEIAKLLATAVQQAKSLGLQRAEAYALGSLGELYELNQQLSNAKELTEQALIKAQVINAPDIAYRWHWQLGRLLKQQGNTQEAIAAYTKAVNNLKTLRSDLVAINPDVQFSFRESVEPVYRQLVQLLLQSQGNSEPSQKNLIQAREVIESLQLAELDNFFRTACLSAQPVLIEQVIDKDNPTTAVIYPIILADRLEVILKLPQQNLRHYATSVPQSQVESTVDQLRQNLIKPYTSPEGRLLSQQIYDWLIRPAEADLSQNKIETLVFVLDGSLRNIPMAALYDGKQYLVQKYSVALAPGLQLLNPKPLSESPFKALVAGLSEERLGFSALTNVAVELNLIKSEIPSSKVLLNQQFTTQALQNQLTSVEFPVVHLATHGQFSSKLDQTFIIAWDKPINVNELSYLLQLKNQSNLNAIELLVLSACQTATGDKRAALGLAGIAVRSGARSTVASLWNLDDESGTLIFSQFYRELAQSRVTKAEALRRAQLSLLNNPSYRHPLFWATYVLVGNWL